MGELVETLTTAFYHEMLLEHGCCWCGSIAMIARSVESATSTELSCEHGIVLAFLEALSAAF